jgi:hypothetical protein
MCHEVCTDFAQAAHLRTYVAGLRKVLGDRLVTQAESLDNLGLALDGIGDRRGAEKCRLESAALFEELGEPRADEVRAHL